MGDSTGLEEEMPTLTKEQLDELERAWREAPHIDITAVYYKAGWTPGGPNKINEANVFYKQSRAFFPALLELIGITRKVKQFIEAVDLSCDGCTDMIEDICVAFENAGWPIELPTDRKTERGEEER